MGYNLVQKVIRAHLLEENREVEALKSGEAIRLKVDQTLTQDSTGTMVYLQLEAMNISKINTEVSVAYVDADGGKALVTVELVAATTY